MPKPYSIIPLLICLCIGLSACGSTEELQSRLDESSGLTVVTVEEPVVFARPTRLAMAARDYAYLGPVEVNRRGERQHFLWIGLASTIDRAKNAKAAAQASQLIIVVDGVPTAMPVIEWDQDLETPPYSGNTPMETTLAVRASLDQIRRIAAADSVEMHIITDSGTQHAYRVWNGEWPAWATFAAAAPGNP